MTAEGVLTGLAHMDRATEGKEREKLLPDLAELEPHHLYWLNLKSSYLKLH